MQSYPGYTRDKINEEFSWREIDELCEWWRKHPPDYHNVDIIKRMIAGYLGVDLTPPCKQTIEGTIEAFKAEGFF
jgi:hypothetical protein